MKVSVTLLFLLTIAFVAANFEQDSLPPAVLIAILARNKAHVLPYFFSYLEDLDYPKDRLGIWIRSDYNEDRSIQIIDTWLNTTQNLYHTINRKYRLDKGRRRTENSISDWPYERQTHVINLKEEALNFARKNWYDYVLFLDADVLLTNEKTLHELIKLKLPVVAPMLTSDTTYSNFWNVIDDQYNKVQNEKYSKIQSRKFKGIVPVECVANALLIDLNLVSSDGLAFDKKALNSIYHSKGLYEGPLDSEIIFGFSAKLSNVTIFLTNQQIYGYVLPPLEKGKDTTAEKESLTNILMEILDQTGKTEVKPYLQQFVTYPKPDTLGFSRIFVINLDRRTERRARYEELFRLVGLNVERFSAVDGRNMTPDLIKQYQIKQLPGYKDPHGKHSMTLGEMGCFLSHYKIWLKMIEENLERVLILEDDIQFRPNFRQNTLNVVKEADNVDKPWDLIYFAKRHLTQKQTKIEGTTQLYEAEYAYWTIAYILTLNGAKKIVEAEPLQKMAPVDEFLHILANKHKVKEYGKHFENKNLIAWNVIPRLVKPLKFPGDPGFVSDTEDY